MSEINIEKIWNFTQREFNKKLISTGFKKYLDDVKIFDYSASEENTYFQDVPWEVYFYGEAVLKGKHFKLKIRYTQHGNKISALFYDDSMEYIVNNTGFNRFKKHLERLEKGPISEGKSITEAYPDIWNVSTQNEKKKWIGDYY